jgi:hypothetical protein
MLLAPVKRRPEQEHADAAAPETAPTAEEPAPAAAEPAPAPVEADQASA